MTRQGTLLLSVLLSAVACRPAPSPSDRPRRPQESVLPEPAIPFAPRTYVAYRAEQPIRVDGRLDEAAWRAAPWTDDFLDIEGPAKRAPRFRTRAKLVWDSTNLYIGAELAEPDVWGTITERDAVIFRDNDFEVFLDPNGDSHQYYELEVNALGTAWDLFLVKPYRDGGPAINGWDIHGLEVGVRVDGTLNRPGDTDRGWSVELALPWAALREAAHASAPPEPGDQWRINFSRVEWRTRVAVGAPGGRRERAGRYEKETDPRTGRPLPEDNWVWSPQGVVNMHYPEMWGIVQFSNRPVEADAATRGDVVAEVPDSVVVRDEHVVKWLLRLVYYRERAFHARQGYYTDDLAKLGLERAPLAGRPWPPVISVTPNGYEASLPAPAGTDSTVARGRRLVITPDGAVR